MTVAPKLRYEPLTEELISVLEAIEHEAYPEPWTTGMFRDEIRNRNSHFFIAYAESTLIGYAGFWLLLDDAHITSVTVEANYRGHGYGRQQLENLIAKSLNLDAQTLTLEVRESNHSARSLYESFGFNPIGLRRGYYAKSKEDAIVMQLKTENIPQTFRDDSDV
jgi:ribosomal-protein-alanine N-acetyltransferase